jgi:hypothetical protein
MIKALQKLLAKKNQFDAASQKGIEDIAREAGAIEALDGMKKTDGWKLLNTKIREELLNHIRSLVADDTKVKTLLSILSTVETKEASKLLEETIASILPE